ncbi:MAG: ECF transporter S component [Candidatus Caldatribacteriaceae bacterium]
MAKVQKRPIRWITRTALLFALVIVIQMLGMPQLVTGPLVNMVLFLATCFEGMGSGLLIGFFTPWVAFSRGILPPPLAPMIPFIMIGNALLVIIFGIFRSKRHVIWEVAGIILSALAKYLFLSQAVTFLVRVPGPVAQAMQIPQLITALLGGVLAMALEKVLRRTLIRA